MANKGLFASAIAKVLPATDIVNREGAPAYALGAEAKLAQLAATGTLNDSFYATAETHLAEAIAAANREIKTVRKLLNWHEEAFAVRELPEERGPGNILLLESRYEHVTEIVSGFGKFGVPAEQLAKRAAGRMKGYLESTAFAGPYLADQLILPFALAGGGVFTTVKPTEHLTTAIDVIGRFLSLKTVISHEAGGTHRVTVG